MVQVLQDPSGLAQGIGGIGSALQQALTQRMQGAQQRYSGNILSNILQGLGENPSAMDIQSAYAQALQQGVDPSLLQSALPKELLKPKSATADFSNLDVDDFRKILVQFGMDEEDAGNWSALYGKLTTGGRTQLAKKLMERMERGFMPPAGEQFDLTDINVKAEDTQFPKLDIFEGMTNAEKVKYQGELSKENRKLYGELNTRKQSLKSDKNRLETLNRLNESGKLPTGLQLMNVDFETGRLKFPAFATPEAQKFVKTVQEFTKNAKESYGARITNFELGAYLAMLPTLANSEEGRRRIIKHMGLMNDLDQLHTDALQEVYKKYGMRNIDSATAEMIAGEISKDREEAILEQIRQLDLEEFSPRGNKVEEVQITEEEKVQPGTRLDKATAAEFVKRTGSKEKARELARKLGYEF